MLYRAADAPAAEIDRLYAATCELLAALGESFAVPVLAAYDRRSRTVAAMERYRDHGLDRRPGQDVRYVVVDDDRRSRDRVRLPFEDGDCDAAFYRERLVRAGAELLSPLGCDRTDVWRHLRDTGDADLSAFG